MESARQNNSLSPANNFPYVKHQTPARNRQRVADPHFPYADNLYANQSSSHQQTFTNVFTQAPHTRHGAVRSSSIAPLQSSRAPPQSGVPFQRAITGTNNGLLQLKDKPKGQSDRAAKYQEKLQKQQLAQLIYAGDECLDPASTRSRLQQKVKINRQQKRLLDRQQLPPDLQGRSLNDRFNPQMFELNSSLQHFSADPQFMNMNKVYPTQRHPFEISSAEVLAKPKKNANAPSSHGTATNKRKPKATRSKKQRQRDKRQRQQQSKNRKTDKSKKSKSLSERKPNGKQQDQSPLIGDEMNGATEPASGIVVNGHAMSIFPTTTSTQLTSPNTNLPLDEVPLLSVQPGADISLVSDSPKHSWFCSSPMNEGGLGASPHLVDERLTLRGDDGQPMTTLVTDSDDEEGEHSPKEYQRLPHSPGERKPLLEHQYRNFSTFEREEDEKVIADNHTDSPHSSATSSPTSSPKQSSSGGLPPPPEGEMSLSKDPMDLLEIEKDIVEQTSSDERVCAVDRTPQEVRNEFAKLMESHQQLEDLGKTLPELPAWELSSHETKVNLGSKNGATEPSSSKSTPVRKNSPKKSKTKKKSKSEKVAEAEAQKAAEKKRANKRRKKREARARKKQRLEDEKRAADADAVRKRIADSVAAAVAAAHDDSDSLVESSSHSESEEETDDFPMDDLDEQDDDESENVDEQVEEVESVSPETSPRKAKRARRRRRKKLKSNEDETKSEDTSSLAPTVSSTNEIVEEEVEVTAPSNQISLEPVSNSDPTYTIVKSKKSRRKNHGLKAANRKSKRGHAIETYSIVRTLPVNSPPTTTASTISAAVKPPLPSTNNKPIIRRPQPVVPLSNSPSTATRKPVVQQTPHPQPNPLPSTTTQSTDTLKPIQRNSASSPSIKAPTEKTTSTSTPSRQPFKTNPVETEQEKAVTSESTLPSVDLPWQQPSEQQHPPTLSQPFLQPQPISATMNFAPFAWSSNSFNDTGVPERSSTTEDSHPSRTERRQHEQVQGRPTKPPVTGLRSFFEAKQANASSSSLTEAVDSFHFDSVPATKSAGTSTEDRPAAPDARPVPAPAPTPVVEHIPISTTHSQSVPYQPVMHQHHHQHQQQQHQHAIPTAPLVSLPTLPNTMPQPDVFSTMPPGSQMFTPMFPYPFPMYATQPQPNMDILNHPDTFAAIAAVTGEMAPPPFLMQMPVFLPPNFQAPLGTLPSIIPPLPMMTTPLRTPLPQVVVNNHDVFSSAVHGNTGAPFQQHAVLLSNDDAINEVEDCLTDEHGDMSVSDQLTTTATTCSQGDEDDVKDCEDLMMEDGKCRRDEDGVIRGTLDLSQMSKSPAGSEHDEMPDLANHSHEGSEHFEDVKNGEDLHGQRPGGVMNSGRKFPTTIFNNAGIVREGGDNRDIQNLLRLTQS